MSVSVSMPQLGESVTEGTVTRWLKREGDHVSADEPLLEVSTDKVDTEIPSPVSGVVRGIKVAEDETVAVGAELAVIDEDGTAGGAAGAPGAAAGQPGPAEPEQAPAAYQPPSYQPPSYQAPGYQAPGYEPAHGYQPPPAAEPEPAAPAYQEPAYQEPGYPPAHGYQPPPEHGYQPPPEPAYQPPAYQPPAAEPSYQAPAPAAPAGYEAPAAAAEPAAAPAQQVSGRAAEAGESPYVTPLVRKLAAEHGIDLASVTGTGVGGRIRKQDVLDAAQARHGGAAPRPVAVPAGAPAAGAPAAGAPAGAVPAAAVPAAEAAAVPAAVPGAAVPGAAAPGAAGRAGVVPSSLRGKTERLPRARQLIAQRMVESLQTSAQLTTVVEADVTVIARLRDRARAGFEAREGVKLSFLPFFALAAVEALKVHPKLNAVIDTDNGTVTYHDAEHLGIAVDTDRGLMVPVIRNAGDLNIGGLARKIADLAQRTRAGQVSPDDLTGGTFTLTNTGSRGALFDTPIINQPQVGILGTGTVNKRAVVVDDSDLGEVITVRSIVYLALTYDHRLVDGADAARFLLTIKNRLEEGAFEAEPGR
ncbi:MAG TPA: 2-oxo acid dehydrogenase subunit E2 [Streptosporangiaceae bacterium]|nr:2-oxo acid dehydrogenase subunit E2 [Streptosporangiaceae bacterium]